MWDETKLARFNFIYAKTITLDPYLRETSLHMSSTNTTSTKSRAGLMVILNSLTPKQRGVFRLIAENQLENPESEGITTAALIEICKKNFLVSNEPELNRMLAEMKDHEIVILKGNEFLNIPLQKHDLELVLNSIPQRD